MPILAPIGRAFLALLAATGRLALFTAAALGNAVRPPYYPRLILKQMIEIGYFSLPVVGLTAIFTGMVLALQSHSGFARFNAESAIATVVVLSVTRELGPVLAGLMVAGRIGAAMAAEIGTMRVTEQIDALTTLSTNPYKYLVAPRLIAGLTMLPLLVLVADRPHLVGGLGVFRCLVERLAVGLERFLVALELLGQDAADLLAQAGPILSGLADTGRTESKKQGPEAFAPGPQKLKCRRLSA